MLCDTLTGCSSNQYQRGRDKSKSVVKYKGTPLFTASSRLLLRSKSKRASRLQPAPSAASQTAWALMGLMAAGVVEHPAVARGVAWLMRRPVRYQVAASDSSELLPTVASPVTSARQTAGKEV